MKPTPHILLWGIFVCVTHSSIITDVKDNVLSFLHRSIANYQTMVDKQDQNNDKRRINRFNENDQDIVDAQQAKEKAKVMKRAKKKKADLGEMVVKPSSGNWKTPEHSVGIERYRMDPVLNFLARRSGKDGKDGKDGSGVSSSSLEFQDWKDEWREHWIQKKFEAINSSTPLGDSINMVAARPWGVPCGDPNQHDMPWGSCMLPMECESEFRIYRGDYFCGRTQFVCCALQLTNYDMYQGFDVSFADSEIQTDSEEARNRNAGSNERRRRKKLKEKRRRSRARQKRKRQIKKNINRIIKEIRKILSRTYRNGTTERKKKTKQLKKFVKNLKKQFKQDRKAVKSIHEIELLKIDERLQRKLEQIRGMNQNFIKNYTFRDIVVNGTVSPEAMRMVIQAYPELISMLDNTRRRSSAPKPDYLEYDIEYGLLYY